MSAPVRPGTPTSTFSRRDALKVAGAIGGTLAAVPVVHGQNPSSDVIRIGLIGAGGRGTGALQQSLSVPGSNVKLTAIGDAFGDRIDGALRAVEEMKDKIECPADRRFQGIDAYKQVLEHCDMVILATPPGLSLIHI